MVTGALRTLGSPGWASALGGLLGGSVLGGCLGRDLLGVLFSSSLGRCLSGGLLGLTQAMALGPARRSSTPVTPASLAAILVKVFLTTA